MFSFSSTYNITNCINHYKTWDSFPHSVFSHSLTSVIWKIQYQMRSKSHLRFHNITRSVNTLQPIITYSAFSLIKVKQQRALHFPRVYKWHQQSACSSVLLFWFGTRKTSKKKVQKCNFTTWCEPPPNMFNTKNKRFIEGDKATVMNSWKCGCLVFVLPCW